MLDFKCCNYYPEAEEKEYCPYSCVCKTKCYFTLQSDTGETVGELQEKIEDLESQVKALNSELDCYTDSSCEDRKQIDCMYDIIVNIIKKQKGVKTYESLKKKYGEILSYLEDYSSNAVGYIINQVL